MVHSKVTAMTQLYKLPDEDNIEKVLVILASNIRRDPIGDFSAKLHGNSKF